MAFCRLLFPLLVLSVASASTVPVFLWGDLSSSSGNSLKSNPLSTVSAQGFSEILNNELKDDPYVIVFLEETLSVEDFSRKNNEGDISIPYLYDNLSDALYLPSVEDASRVLEEVAKGAVHVKLTQNGLSAAIEDKNNRFMFIALKDAMEGESRYDLLRRHSNFMEDQISKLEKKGDVIAVYTARNPSWTIPDTHSRVRRQANSSVTNGPDYSLDGLRLYLTGVTLDHSNASVTFTNYAGGSSEYNTTTGVLNGTLNFDQGSLTLNFHRAAGYWFFDTVHFVQTNPAVDEILYATDDLNALLDFSYRCKQSVSFKSINETQEYKVSFIDIKVQPFFGPTNASTPFGDSFNCVGFFSAPIWSGLFVVFILLSITFYGIMTMMDIKTMDRFDDPKGKTITINAGE
uniref:Vacuolar ATP synthase subunit S1 n=1 Tax=Bombyx mori TaxID=7091 RepID=A0A8R2M6D9_BOMMO|nr:V-type proton ATPase subunit S1 [Bombyx mori]